MQKNHTHHQCGEQEWLRNQTCRQRGRHQQRPGASASASALSETVLQNCLLIFGVGKDTLISAPHPLRQPHVLVQVFIIVDAYGGSFTYKVQLFVVSIPGNSISITIRKGDAFEPVERHFMYINHADLHSTNSPHGKYDSGCSMHGLMSGSFQVRFVSLDDFTVRL
jgi:hypothetical protein